MIKYTPNRSTRQAGVISAILFAVAAVSYIFSVQDFTSPLPLQLLCLGCICAGVYILVRYAYTGVTYIIRKNESSGHDCTDREAFDFCVIKKQGQREGVTECLISFDKLIKAEIYSDGLPSRLREEFKNVKLYVYTQSMFPAKRQALVFEDGCDVLCIVIEASDEFFAAIEGFCTPSEF